ncbi:hypothetical protein C8J56DRAFT_917358 [Mycena floridula]|nr:hypothetical protein C8J56DRAFT_917358 [Mycena floridula]
MMANTSKNGIQQDSATMMPALSRPASTVKPPLPSLKRISHPPQSTDLRNPDSCASLSPPQALKPSSPISVQRGGKISVPLHEALGKPDKPKYVIQRDAIIAIAEKHLDWTKPYQNQSPEITAAFLAELEQTDHLKVLFGEQRVQNLAHLASYLSQRISNDKSRKSRPESQLSLEPAEFTDGEESGTNYKRKRSERKSVPNKRYAFDRSSATPQSRQEEDEQAEVFAETEFQRDRASCSHEIIIEFLESCSPPMPYLADALVAAGCVNSEFIFAISSWPLSEIYEFLGESVKLDDGTSPTPLEVRILGKHFAALATVLEE